MTAIPAASVALDGCKVVCYNQLAGWSQQPPCYNHSVAVGDWILNVVLSLACCPLEVKANSTMCSEKNASASSTASLDLGRQVQFGRDKAQKKPTDEEIKGDQSTEEKQDDEVGSAMTEEFNSSFMGVSENRRQPKHDAVPFKDWVWARSMGQNPQGLERMESGLSVVTSYGGESNGCDDLTRYSMSMDQARRTIMTAARSTAMNNAEEPSGTERSDLRDYVGQKLKAAMDGNASASSSSSAAAAVMACLPGEHLFDKAVTPSDVGKLNRLVIPKQHAEKYFPLDINSIEKGLLLNFEDNRGKIWTFRYSYWNSSQSYVLTKGWTRFVKDKKLEAGDIVSFQRGSTDQHHQLYISWRRGPSGLSRFRFGPQPHQSKAGLVYPVKGSSSLNPLNSGTQATVLYNSQWMPIFWPSSSNPNAFTQLSAHTVSPLVNKVVQWDAVWSQSPVTPLHGTLPFSLSAPPHKQTVQSRLYDINSRGLQPADQYLSLHNSFNSSEGGTNIEALHPFVNPAPLSAAQELEDPEHKPASSVDLTTKKGVRLFGVTLAEPRR